MIIKLGFHGLLQLAALPRPMLTGDRGRFSVFSHAVTTTPETEAEAETVAEPTIPETTDDAPPPTLKTKKLTKRVKHIMEVSKAALYSKQQGLEMLPLYRKHIFSYLMILTACSSLDDHFLQEVSILKRGL